MCGDVADAIDCCDSNAEGEDAIADGVKAMHVSVASSVDDDGQSSVEILSPAFNHYKQAGMLISNIIIVIDLKICLIKSSMILEQTEIVCQFIGCISALAFKGMALEMLNTYCKCTLAQ
jgi:hypothetical protein